MIATAVVVGTIGVVYGESGVVHQLHGSGTTNPSRLFWKVQVCVHESTAKTKLTWSDMRGARGELCVCVCVACWERRWGGEALIQAVFHDVSVPAICSS